MRKKLTLDETWDLCLKMWEWIDGRLRKDGDCDAVDLKAEWLRRNHHGNIKLYNNCFFCEYNAKHGGYPPSGECDACPAKLVDGKFKCEDVSCDWLYHPRAFYRKLVELNKTRLAKRK